MTATELNAALTQIEAESRTYDTATLIEVYDSIKQNCSECEHDTELAARVLSQIESDVAFRANPTTKPGAKRHTFAEARKYFGV